MEEEEEGEEDEGEDAEGEGWGVAVVRLSMLDTWLSRVQRTVPIDYNRSITLAIRVGDVGVNVAVDGWFVGHLFSLSVTVCRRTGEENQKYMLKKAR